MYNLNEVTSLNETVNFYLHSNVVRTYTYLMALPVIEFQDQGYKIKKIFA